MVTTKPLIFIDYADVKKEEEGLYEGTDKDYLIVRKGLCFKEKEFKFGELSLAKMFWSEDFEVKTDVSGLSMLDAERVIKDAKTIICDEVFSIMQSVRDIVIESFEGIITYKGEVWRNGSYGSDSPGIFRRYAEEYATFYKNIEKINIFCCSCDVDGQRKVVKILKEEYEKDVSHTIWYCPHGDDTDYGKIKRVNEAKEGSKNFIPFNQDLDLQKFLSWVTES